jgi:hypothetical protein
MESAAGGLSMTKVWGLVAANKLVILFLALIVTQILTWRAVVDVWDEVDNVKRAVRNTACGDTSNPCQVVIKDR